ncbi:hypothetical protein GGF31_005935 [Allomyces arbusculus]|nr:hypothetical protein GGF31_005935 [Allomyces arbusculus]
MTLFCWRTPQPQPRRCTNSLQSSGPRPTTATMTFFTVKYGDNDERLFNSNCLNTVLLGHIKAALKLTFPEPVDLALDSGDVLDLASKPREYAKKYIEPRAVCTLLKVVQDEDDGGTAYVPLLDNAAADRFRVAGGARRNTTTTKPRTLPTHSSTAAASTIVDSDSTSAAEGPAAASKRTTRGGGTVTIQAPNGSGSDPHGLHASTGSAKGSSSSPARAAAAAQTAPPAAAPQVGAGRRKSTVTGK